MATLYEPGNKEIFANEHAGNSSKGLEDEIISKTKEVAFPTEAQISLENFDHYGDVAAGTQQRLGDMVTLTGKQLQESYRAGHSESMKLTQKVSDR